jgi:hypothetical protein
LQADVSCLALVQMQGCHSRRVGKKAERENRESKRIYFVSYIINPSLKPVMQSLGRLVAKIAGQNKIKIK